jgi:hypothetical protein
MKAMAYGFPVGRVISASPLVDTTWIIVQWLMCLLEFFTGDNQQWSAAKQYVAWWNCVP